MLLGVLLLLIGALELPEVTVGWYCDMPAEMATLVCMHRRKGDECMTTLWVLRFLFLLPWPFWWLESDPFSASFRDCSRACNRLAIRTPRARHCVQPP
jgi:hypothetical protein